MTIVFDYFHKKLILNLWEGSEYVPVFNKSDSSLNIRKFS